jgi:hypothetical protein
MLGRLAFRIAPMPKRVRAAPAHFNPPGINRASACGASGFSGGGAVFESVIVCSVAAPFSILYFPRGRTFESAPGRRAAI